MPLNKKAVFAHLAMLSATLLYGANYSIAKSLMPYPLPPFVFIIVRVVVATSIFWILHAFSVKEKIRHKADFISSWAVRSSGSASICSSSSKACP